MRTFFAFDLPTDVKLAIAEWRDQVYSVDARYVPTANFHITLQFIGNTSPHQLEHLMSAEFPFSRFTLRCQDVGYFSKPKVGFLLVDNHEAIRTATKQCRQAAKHSGITISNDKLTPHITLFRKLKSPLPYPLLPPAFEFTVDSLCLFESVSTATGVKYQPLRSWSAKS
ncbi:MAG: RNA 2',3'-cyclic phosphodiesterase [Aestuariibacter sp.]